MLKIIYILDLEKFMVAIIDYGAGNLMSVKKLLIISALKMKLRWTRIKFFLLPILFCRVSAHSVMLYAIYMESRGLVETVKAAARSGKPFLRVSASVLQLLFAKSDESKNVDGLALLNGEIVSIPKDMEA